MGTVDGRSGNERVEAGVCVADIRRHFDDMSHERDEHIAESPTVDYEQRMRHRFVRGCFEAVRPVRVLDVGCGNGRDVIALARDHEGCRIEGVDISPGMIDEAEKCLSSEPDTLSRRVAFTVRDLSRPSSTDGRTFDMVVCSEVLEHVPEYRIMLSNLADSLEPSGHAVVTVPNRRSLYGLNRLLLERRNARRGKRPWPHPYDEWKQPSELRAASREAGFEVVLERGACYLPGFTLFDLLPEALSTGLISAVSAVEPALDVIAPRFGYMYCLLLKRG